MKQVLIQKIEELEDAKIKNNIPIGNCYRGFEKLHPIVGDRYQIFIDKGYFITSKVEEVIPMEDGITRIKTENSMYQIETL